MQPDLAFDARQGKGDLAGGLPAGGDAFVEGYPGRFSFPSLQTSEEGAAGKARQGSCPESILDRESLLGRSGLGSEARSLDLREGVAIAVGGDVDTTAAMTGAIAGAHSGIKAIPADLTRRLNDQGTWGKEALIARGV